MIHISEIQRLIEDYERREVSASKIIESTQDVDQYHRVYGKREAYVAFMRELKELLPIETIRS